MTITKKSTVNKFSGRNGWKPDIIVLHTADGTYDGTVGWMQNSASQVSSHFVVAKDGRITQLVDIKDGAWCNGTSTDPTKNTHYGKASLAAVRERKTNANYYTVSIEHEGLWKDTKGKLTDAQLASTITLIKYIIAEVKAQFGVDIPIDREHIVGHYQISPVTRPNCPGAQMQWDAIISALKVGEQGDTVDYHTLYSDLLAKHNGMLAGLQNLLDKYKEA